MATPPEHLSIHELLTLTHLAGLEVSPAREPLVLAELNAQLANARLIDSLLPGPTPAATLPYDPTFPPVSVDEETGR